MADYQFYFKKYVREAYAGEGDKDSALAFLGQYNFGLVKDSEGNVYNSKKELKNAKSFRSTDRVKRDSSDTGFGSLSKDSDRELSGSSKRNSE